MNKVKTMEEAYRVFDLLGIKEVTKKWQKANGSEVWELPFKTMYANGVTEINRFTIYRSGYIRKMVVHPETNASYSCYQLNRTRKNHEYVKDYEWNSEKDDLVWTGKYRKSERRERILIDNHRDRVVYLCNYILKNYYRSQTGAGFYRINDYQVSLMKNTKPEPQDLPFKCESETFTKDEVKVIINGHRYNLS